MTAKIISNDDQKKYCPLLQSDCLGKVCEAWRTLSIEKKGKLSSKVLGPRRRYADEEQKNITIVKGCVLFEAFGKLARCIDIAVRTKSLFEESDA